jgi:hypothetical protein
VTVFNTITAAQETSTYTETIPVDETTTITSTSTIVASIKEFETSTQELEEILTTFSTLAGFLPIQSDSANQPQRKRSQQRPDADRAQSGSNSRPDHDRSFPPNLRRYPAYVSCDHVIRVYTTKFSTSTASRLMTITAETPTVQISSTSTHTLDTYETPPIASTTVTESTTSTISTTEVVSETSTSTTTETQIYIAQPTSTVFPACSPDNMLSSHGGDKIIFGQQSPGATKFASFDGVPGGASSAEQCCQM